MSNGNTVSSTDIWIGRIGAIFSGFVLLIQFYFAATRTTSEEIKEVKETVNQKTETVIDNQEKQQKQAKETAEELRLRLQKQLAELEEQELTRGSQLYTNWKYLEDLGETKKAAEAKKLYEDFRKKRAVKEL